MIIQTVAATALSSIHLVLNRWVPGGKREGHEYLPLNPKRADRHPGSFSINLNDGSWADFATGDKGGDLVSLVAYLDDISQGEAAKRLIEFLGIKTEKKDSSKPATMGFKSRGNAKVCLNPNKAVNGASDEDDGLQCVMPVPDHAPLPPMAHSRYGKPSQRHSYCASDGRINFYHDRFDPTRPDERKQFAPLTLWQKGEILRWKFKAPPEPRPLNGLPSLSKHPDANVWIVEGEKAAIALEKLLPNHPVLTWQGGSQAVIKSDYTPLTGRNCIIWPDNDEAGEKAAGNLVKALKAVKAASVNILNIRKLERKDGMPLQPGDDAHDLLTVGWTTEKFAEFLARDDALISAHSLVVKQNQQQAIVAAEQSDDVETNGRFQLLDSGLYVNEPQIKDGNYRLRWICSPIKPLAMVRTENGNGWGLLVWLINPDGNERRIIISMRSFNGDAASATAELLDNGLMIGKDYSRKLLVEYLLTTRPSRRASISRKTGWHGEADNSVYLLPNATIGCTAEEWLYVDPPENTPYKERGTLEQWQDNVAALCAGNNHLMFSISTAFASTLLRLTNVENGGFHWISGSTCGKSTGLYVACSVFGSPNYFNNWRATSNGLEGLALSRNDALLVLDELKEVDPFDAVQSAYMLGNGQGKVRATVSGAAREQAVWRLLYLSSGEISLSQHAATVGKKTHTGAELRLIEMNADAGAGMGFFENIHTFDEPKYFAETLTKKAAEYYGTPSREFVKHVLEEHKNIANMFEDCVRNFIMQTKTSNAGPQVKRAASRFALIGFAGELAIRWNIVPWQPGEAITASAKCFLSWIVNYGGIGNKEERDMLSYVRQYLNRHHEDRFTNIKRSPDKDFASKTIDRTGFRETIDERTHYYIFPEMFVKDMCKGLNDRLVLKLLIGRGYACKGDGSNLKPKITIPGEGKKRMVHILPSIFDDED